MRDLIIVGAGGHGREVLDIVEAVNAERPTWRFLGFLDDGHPPVDRLVRRSARLLGPVSDLAEIDAAYVVGIGDGGARRQVDVLAGARQAAVLVHPLASIGADVEMGPGCVLAAGARVTTNVRLGRHVHLNVAAVVSHDCRIGDYATLSPGASVNGACILGEEVLLGTGVVVTPGREVGSGAWVGAGGVVVDDIPSRVVAVGVPARTRRHR